MYGFHYFPIVTDVLLTAGGGLMAFFFLFLKKQGRILKDSMKNRIADEETACDVERLFRQLYCRMMGFGIFIALLGVANLASDCLGGASIVKTITCCLLFVAFIACGVTAGTALQKISNTLNC